MKEKRTVWNFRQEQTVKPGERNQEYFIEDWCRKGEQEIMVKMELCQSWDGEGNADGSRSRSLAPCVVALRVGPCIEMCYCTGKKPFKSIVPNFTR